MIFTKLKRVMKAGFVNFWRNGWVSYHGDIGRGYNLAYDRLVNFFQSRHGVGS